MQCLIELCVLFINKVDYMLLSVHLNGLAVLHSHSVDQFT